MDEVKLLPCAFCGGTDIAKEDNGHAEWLRCNHCGATGPWIEPPEDHYFTGTELADQWNTRPTTVVTGEHQGERATVVTFLRAEADAARHAQGNAADDHPDKLYRMGQKDGLMLAADAIERGHHRAQPESNT